MYKKRAKTYNRLKFIGQIRSEKEREERREVIENEKYRIKQIAKTVHIGQTVQGKVSEILDRGAVIAFKGLTGFLHISEISYDWVNHPKDFLHVGQELKLKIISKNIDYTGQVSIKLSRKQLLKSRF
ncbi:S1 RNA-binding domain-containing protein [candidate division CSSED10-310 bacterium]|uniref:S1 RNA-binding domain-containing protein n=1 Tax=candidate division CSSED10-310 bacterium TaxID=2855610 RepID=A0ABV6YXM9_UNCC1